ncbi:hypothetical protein cyc_06385 [Cyclospora cayetanensis]|uniref:Uncharacterized protein n=1 Tax=Cyclospora cayetanensis TaxID=88456 RepID=A0A1D3DAF0_9EIME|nr:hypothetical protein cyc_06385 [Cyclospora cayetanensis]
MEQTLHTPLPHIKAPVEPVKAPTEPVKAPIVAAMKPEGLGELGAMYHPSGAWDTASTSSGGPSINSCSSIVQPVSSSTNRLSSSFDESDVSLKSNRGDMPSTIKHQYVGVLPGVLSSSSASGGLPSKAVAIPDMSPAWGQYQISTTPGTCTPLYCSLTPTRIPSQQGPASGDVDESQAQPAYLEPAHPHRKCVHSSESLVELHTDKNPSYNREGGALGSRKLSLLLNETPLQVDSLPQEVQAMLHKEGESVSQELPVSVPRWFDAETGCIRHEYLPELPSYRMTLNTSVAKLSAASRVYQRTRWPGEPAKVAFSGSQPYKARSIRRISCPETSILRRKSDFVSASSQPQSNIQAPAETARHARNTVLSDVSGGLAARNRRVRFATVASAREYTERSPSPVAGVSMVSEPPTLAGLCQDDPWGTPEDDRLVQFLPGDKISSTRATKLLDCMMEIVQRLLKHSSVHSADHAQLETSLRLLQHFGTECVGRVPALCFLADTLEACEQLVKDKLPEEEAALLLLLIEATKKPLLSREAVLRLHRIKQQMRYPQYLDLFLTPLETLQRLRICDRRKATTRLSLYAAIADETLLDPACKVHANAFLVNDSACGIVTSRPWNGSKNPRAFAVDILKLCEEDILASQQRMKCDESSPSGQQANPRKASSITMIIESALRRTSELGTCSMGLLALDDAGERLRFATCGFVRLLVLRRSSASGILSRVAEAPVRNAAVAAETQLFKWPSKKELIDDIARQAECQDTSGVDTSKGTSVYNCKCILRQALLRVIEWAENGNGWSSRGLVEQEVSVQEGDFFIMADDILFDIVSSEEMRHLFSCCLTPEEGKDATDISLCISPTCLPNLLKRLWKQRVPDVQALLSRVKDKQQRIAAHAIGRRGVPETLEACPLDLPIVAGWIRNRKDHMEGEDS